MTEEEEQQQEFNRKADAAAPEAVGCCLLSLFSAIALLPVALVPLWLLFG